MTHIWKTRYRATAVSTTSPALCSSVSCWHWSMLKVPTRLRASLATNLIGKMEIVDHRKGCMLLTPVFTMAELAGCNENQLSWKRCTVWCLQVPCKCLSISLITYFIFSSVPIDWLIPWPSGRDFLFYNQRDFIIVSGEMGQLGNWPIWQIQEVPESVFHRENHYYLVPCCTMQPCGYVTYQFLNPLQNLFLYSDLHLELGFDEVEIGWKQVLWDNPCRP